jgi:hypothetical protein
MVGTPLLAADFAQEDKSAEKQGEISSPIKAGQIWRHYKGHDYRVIARSLHTEEHTWYVVYEALYDCEFSQIWHRPEAMFLEELEVDGKMVRRFTLVTPNL